MELGGIHETSCSHFGETLSGAPTIRAYRMLPAFIEENERLVDFNQASRRDGCNSSSAERSHFHWCTVPTYRHSAYKFKSAGIFLCVRRMSESEDGLKIITLDGETICLMLVRYVQSP